MRVFTKHIIHTFSFQVIGFFVGVGTSVIIARGLGPEGKGLFSLSMLIFSFLVLFSNFGLNQATTYFTGSKKYPASDILGSNTILTLLISIAALPVGLVLVFFFNEALFPGVPQAYLLYALALFPIAYFFDLTSQVLLGLQRIQPYNTLKFFTSVLYLVFLLIFFAFFSLSVPVAIITNIVAYALVAIALFFRARKEAGGVNFSLNFSYIKDAFSYGLKVYLANMFYLARPQINVFLLNIFLNPTAVGFYVTAFGLSEVMQWFSKSAATVLFPRVAAETDKDSLKRFTPIVARNIIFVTLIASLLLLLIGKWIITLLYSSEFLPSVAPFFVMLIGVVATAGWMIIHTDIFARGKPLINTYLFGASVALNTLLNLLLIPSFGIMGAAWSLTISYLFIFCATLIAYMRISQNRLIDVLFIKPSDFAYWRDALDLVLHRLSRK